MQLYTAIVVDLYEPTSFPRQSKMPYFGCKLFVVNKRLSEHMIFRDINESSIFLCLNNVSLLNKIIE